jgi:hypothetical protein
MFRRRREPLPPSFDRLGLIPSPHGAEALAASAARERLAISEPAG